MQSSGDTIVTLMLGNQGMPGIHETGLQLIDHECRLPDATTSSFGETPSLNTLANSVMIRMSTTIRNPGRF
jgi:hypothetical protein